jgi:hypothetical protein
MEDHQEQLLMRAASTDYMPITPSGADQNCLPTRFSSCMSQKLEKKWMSTNVREDESAVCVTFQANDMQRLGPEQLSTTWSCCRSMEEV